MREVLTRRFFQALLPAARQAVESTCLAVDISRNRVVMMMRVGAAWQLSSGVGRSSNPRDRVQALTSVYSPMTARPRIAPAALVCRLPCTASSFLKAVFSDFFLARASARSAFTAAFRARFSSGVSFAVVS